MTTAARSFRTAVLGATLTALAVVSTASPAHAQISLVGLQLYQSAGNGSNAGGAYQYSTNSATSHYGLVVNGTDYANTVTGAGASNFAIPLALGLNTFTFSGDISVPVSMFGLNLFFNASGASYNPVYSSAGAGIPGNLTVFGTVGTSGFATPGAGISVLSFNSDGANTKNASSTGATSFQVGGQTVTVTSFSANSTPGGSFTLTVAPTVTATPEPASLALVGAGLAGVTAFARRRRSNV